VFSPEFENKQVLIAEMGAKKSGDISTLRDLVKPDYVVFTGVCEQHIATFGSIENVWAEKSEVLRGDFKRAVLGEDLKAFVDPEFTNESRIVFASGDCVKETRYFPTKTSFVLVIDGEEIAVETELLGEAAVENIALAATTAREMGLTAAEIARGIEKLKPVPHRLQLLRSGEVYILDDGYNCNPRGAKRALDALGRFEGRKCVVTPGIVECGILEETENAELGKVIADLAPDKVILVGNTLVGAVKSGYENANGDMDKLTVVKTLTAAQEYLADWVSAGDCVLFLNDLPDIY
jgi:UDP-N-acetylmuramoyl-tripeptide--D-alanyl-D-alanine ligase